MRVGRMVASILPPLPLSSYNQQAGQPVTITIRPPADAGKPTEAISALNGKLNANVNKQTGSWIIELPKLGFGDMVRINTK